ncbi:TetR/AcrR family transcriptional regulator [Streptomyces sp. ME02-8801-2C]|uniref:TetR/AcrR family transcriptional regulator n=1 Tax=Streptomyces sp. ME02-8801-2C TaxID=3028680 RepID=UPI0029BE56F5|nr:TetR/AcrR family transcriptional regulator [Streptomyces sp. ME02-8801-2C]MDX3451866.1 TetR/AcrR family transcriptional regulator [Streptomyces sp. ME02-8801-2C]
MATTKDRAPKRRVDARSSVERITAAGRIVLGTGEASLEQIAAEAGVGIATLYRHFPNREAIVRAVLDDILETDLFPLIDDAAEAPHPRQALQSIATHLLDLVVQEQGLVTFASNFADVAVNALQRLSDSLHPVLLRAQQQGEIRPDLTAEDIPRFLVMAVVGLGLPGTAPSLRARFIALLFDSLNPANATPLPPLLPEEGDLHIAVGNVAAHT